MSREEFIRKLQMVYVGDKNASADIIAEFDRIRSIISNDFAIICREKMVDKLSATEMILLQEKKIENLQNIIKEVREYIKEHSTTINFKTMRADYNLNMNELLEILDKGE